MITGKQLRRSGLDRLGFTLVELLVVIAIIGVLVALLLPAVQAAREAARRSQCMNNLKQLALATHSHHDSSGALPIGVYNDASAGFSAPEVGLGWGAKILPFIEQANIYDQLNAQLPVLANVNNPWDAENTSTGDWVHVLAVAEAGGNQVPGARTVINTFRCPSSGMPAFKETNLPEGLGPFDEGYALSSYKASQGAIDDGMYFKRGDGAESVTVTLQPADMGGDGPAVTLEKRSFKRVRFKDVQDGLSNTIALGESAYEVDGAFPLWIGATINDESALFKTLYADGGGRSIMPNCGPDLFSSYPFTDDERRLASNDCAYSWHPGGCMFAFGDGSVHFLSLDISPRLYVILGAMADGNIINRDELN